MSPDQVTGVPADREPLSLYERRVLGVLVEKAKTTPDVYPLSMNSLISGCNQKSNRDPVMGLTDYQVEEALAAAQKKGLVTRVTGGRVERWRHLLYESWKVDKVELAVIAELLLRGPQTEGELRGRASRMERIDDLDRLREVLRSMVERRLVVYLRPEGKRGTIVTHGFHAREELEKLQDRYQHESSGMESEAVATSESPRPASRGGSDAQLNEIRDQIEALRSNIAELQSALQCLQTEVQEIKHGLGLGA